MNFPIRPADAAATTPRNICRADVRKVAPFLLGEIALDFEWSAEQASDWPATYFLGHRGLDLRNYAPALLWAGVNGDPGAALPSPPARRPAGHPPAAALTAIHVPLEEGHRPVGARRHFPIELLAFPPFPPAHRASLPLVGAAVRHPSLSTGVAHIRARPHNSARQLLPTPKNRNQMMVSRIHTCRRSLPRRSARNAIRVAVLRRAAAQGKGRVLP
jgi:hypothetical protein